MNSILNRQKQLAEQSRLLREKQRSVPPRPPRVPAGPLEVAPEGIAVDRLRRTVKIGSKRKMKKKTRGKNNGQRTAKNKTRK